MPFGWDMIPGVNFGNGVKQALTGKDYDIFSNYSAKGGDRNPVGTTAFGVGKQVNGSGSSSGSKKTTSNGGGNGNGNGGGDNGAYYAGSTAVAAPAYDKDELAKYDQAISQIKKAQGRVGDQWGVARGNINDQYGIQSNELKGAYNNANKSYDTSTLQNSQSLRTNNNNINDTHSAGARGLARLLGSLGVGGSSDMGVMFDTVSGAAAQDRSGANQTYAQNQQGLDTNWNNFVSDNDREKEQLGDWRSKQLRSAEQQSKTTEAELSEQLARLRGERSEYKGGSFASGAKGALKQANDLYDQATALGRFNPKYSGKTPTYTQRDLDSYLADNDATFETQSLPGAENSYIARLLGEDDRDDDRVVF